jgi:hypothetical protein
MNWDAVGAIGELVGSLAVFVTLGYLAMQVNHARAETRRALSQGRMEANRELIALELYEPNLAATMKAEQAFQASPPPVVTMIEGHGLSREEAWRVFLVEITRWNYRVHVITHAGDLSSAEKSLFDGAIRVRFASKVVRLVYEEHLKPGAHPDVVKYIEEVLAEVRPS